MVALTLPEPRLALQGGRRAAAAQLVRFGVVGGAATVVQLAVYAFLAADLGAQLANVVSWLLSTLLATEGHRRFSFATTGRSAESDHTVGLATSLAGLVISSLVLAALGGPVGMTGAVAVVAVNGAVGLLRFAALRWWLIGVAR